MLFERNFNYGAYKNTYPGTRLVTELIRKSDEDSNTLILNRDELVSLWLYSQIVSRRKESYDDEEEEDSDHEKEETIVDVSEMPPDVREVIIRALTRRSTLSKGRFADDNGGVLCVHRMYALLHKNEFRLALAVSDSEY